MHAIFRWGIICPRSTRWLFYASSTQRRAWDFYGLKRPRTVHHQTFRNLEDDHEVTTMSEKSSLETSIKTSRSAKSDVSNFKSSRHSVNDDPSENYEKLSPLHEKLYQALSESEVLSALHVDVRNDSYWYHMRKRMGPKKQGALIVKFHENSQKWESYIFKMKVREEDMEIVPKKSLTGSYKSKWAAYKASEAATKERDANPAKNKKLGEILLPEKIMSTHFRILVVSEQFHRMSTIDRHCLVYEELIRAIGVNILPMDNPLGLHGAALTSPENSGSHTPGGTARSSSSSSNIKQGLGRCAPTRLKLASIYGQTMCSLPLFRFLLPDDAHPLCLMVDARTPSQWRPEIYKPPLSERLGSAHNSMRALQMDAAAKPKSHQVRVKKLTTVVTHEMLHQIELSAHHVSGTGSTRKASNASHSTSGIAEASSPLLASPTHAPMGDDDASFASYQSQRSASPEKTSQTIKHLDSIGLDAAVSGVKYKKLGGIYGHFFNDLSPDIRELVMSKYKDNKTLIRDESNLEIMKLHAQLKKEAHTADTNQPVTNISRMRAKQQAATVAGEYDKGTSSEAEMLQEVNISNLRMERAAVRLQRIRRMYIWHRAVKKYWWQHYAAMTVQRCVRGHFGRQYAALFRSLRPRAAVRIQRCFRTSQSRVFLRIWQYIAYKLTRIVLPKIKRFIRNCFLSWLRRRAVYATRIQAIVRGFNGRARYYKKLGEVYYFTQVFPVAALKIQKVIRGFLGRCRMRTHLNAVLHRHIVIPATIRIQRIYRGRLAKFVLAKLKVRAAAVKTLQDFIRAFVHRMWQHQLDLEVKRKHAATQIQRLYRGALDRQLYRMKAHIRWYNTRYIPAIIYIQACTRRYRAAKYVHFLKSKNRAVLKIQQSYANYCAKKLAKAVVRDLRKMREFRAASNIQRYVRRRIAIVAFRRKQLEYKGKITAAAKIIMRAWTNYLLSRRYKHLLDEHRRKAFGRRIEKLIENREDVHMDVKEIQVDIALATRAIERYKDRIKLVETFEAQASIRQGKVKLEMSQLKPEDFERGWAEALGQEYETLSYQTQMSREELRLLRHHIKRRQREILYLQIELEEIEMDMDTMEVMEMEAEEALRRAEIALADRDSSHKFNREVRREKSHWRITSNRKNVILRNRPRYQAILAQTKKDRDLRYASTISYERRAREWDAEQLTQEKVLAADQRKQDEENRPKTYTEYAGPVQDTYDTIVTNSLSLLRGMSLDERASKLRDQFKSREVKKKKAQKGQFAPLKEEVDSKRRFDQYK